MLLVNDVSHAFYNIPIETMISGKHSTAHNTMTGKKKSERETKSVLERTRAIVSMET